MALFLDGPASSIDDLTGYDSQLLEVASTERIDVTRKLTLAQEEIGVDLEALLARGAANSAGAELGNIVNTPALKLWHAYRTLELVYGDAYNSQLNDRYAGRRDQFRSMARWAREKLIETGLGLTATPVRAAAAPSLTTIPGILPEGTYYVTVTYVNASGEESKPAPATVATSVDGGFTVQLSSVPAGVTGWNLYAGGGPLDMTLQNGQILAVDQSWMLTSALTQTGRRPGDGQPATVTRAVPRMIQRG